MGFLIRMFLLTIVIYFFIKIIKNIFSPKRQDTPKVKPSSQQNITPPYDPKVVEDIDFQEIKKSKKDKG